MYSNGTPPRFILHPCIFRPTLNPSPAGSYPNCPTIVLNWSHGTFQLAPNGSILFTPVGDGFQQIQDPCAARSDFVEVYNDTELYQSWQIFTDPTDGPKLHMFAFDGSPEPPMRLLSGTPNMYPNQRLTNASQQSPTTILKRANTNIAAPIHWWNVVAVATVGAMLGSALLI